MADPAGSAGPADVEQKRFSCHQCRARKLKCNRVWPCERCVQLGEADKCQFAETRRRPGHVAKRPMVKELEGRLMDLEHRLKQQQLEHEQQQHTAGLSPLPSASGYSQVIPTGRLEQLPPQSVVDELTSIYFSRQQSDAPMQDPTRYLASLHRPPHMQPPMCLQYAILAVAASHSPTHKELALPFYYRARNYIEHDEMRADGHHAMTLGHAQCWVLLGHFEAGRLWYVRASLSVSRSVRLAQMLGLYDVEGTSGIRSFGLAPTDKWQEKEERRRTMWAIFCTDRLTSSTTGWHPLVDARQVRTLLPASDEAFLLGVEEPSLTLHKALGNTSAQLSPFACRALAAHVFYDCLEHSFTRYPDDEESEFWKRQQNLDNRLAVLFMVLPNSVRCPENLARHDAVLINLTLHTASICIHRVGLVRAKRGASASPQASQAQGAAGRLVTAARAIFGITNHLQNPHAFFSNSFVAFAAYMAGLVFLDDFATTHNQQSEECLSTLMDLMVAIANENLLTTSLVLQLAGHLKKSGIDPSALDKVKHLAAKVDADGSITETHIDHTGTVLFCPFQPGEEGQDQV